MYTDFDLEAEMKIPAMNSATLLLACLTAMPVFAASCDSLLTLALPDTPSAAAPMAVTLCCEGRFTMAETT